MGIHHQKKRDPLCNLEARSPSKQGVVLVYSTIYYGYFCTSGVSLCIYLKRNSEFLFRLATYTGAEILRHHCSLEISTKSQLGVSIGSNSDGVKDRSS